MIKKGILLLTVVLVCAGWTSNSSSAAELAKQASWQLFQIENNNIEQILELHRVMLFPDDESGMKQTQGEMATKVPLTLHELYLLAKIIHAEARGEVYAGQVAVGAVVLNRVESSEFPDGVKDVIEQPRAFTAVRDGQYELQPDNSAYRAALDAALGKDPTGGALYYFNPVTATSQWIRTREHTDKIGRHQFAI